MRLGGATEVAHELSVSPSRVTVLRQRPDFPDPVGQILQGPIWDLDVIAAWNQSGLRRSGAGRPSAQDAKRTLGDRFIREERPIGKGGFADVYRAVDKKTGATVAIKILRDIATVDEESIKRFQRELRIMEQLSNSHVIPILSQGRTSSDEIWYAMPLAQGSLADYARDAVGNPPQIVDTLRQVCAGLEYIHAEGIYHRDLKPGNILRLRTENGGDNWAISDFGLAVMVERDTAPLTSTLRQGLGSWWYTAPEQWTNARSANHLSDIFSLGKILQELVTGEPPAQTEIAPGPFRPVIERALSTKPSARYQSVQEFVGALDRVIDAEHGHRDKETREAQAERLRDLLLSKPAPEELVELLLWAESIDESDTDDMAALTRVLPWASNTSIKFLWTQDPQTFSRVLGRFCEYVGVAGFSFEYTDTLANFMRRVTTVTTDPLVGGKIASALVRLGCHHNRWHVRDVLVEVLQRVKTREQSIAIVEAIRSAPIDEVRWSITDFTLRSLPASIRPGLTDVVGS